jgi:hypothetical protein
VTRTRLRPVALGLALLVSLPAMARAEQDAQSVPGAPGQARATRPNARGRAGMPPRPANPDTMTTRQVEQYFDQVVLFQARTRLNLDDAQFLRFGAALRQLQDARRTQQRRRAEMLRQLDTLLAAPDPDDNAVTARMKEIDDFGVESNRRIQDAYAAIDGVLSVRQRARFRVFEEMMERRKLDLLARARQQANAPGQTSSAGPSPAR